MYRRMKPLGATHMTGGGNPFYSAIGYEPMILHGPIGENNNFCRNIKINNSNSRSANYEK